MRHLKTVLALLAFGVFAAASNAVTINISTSPFAVNSTNTHNGQPMTLLVGGAANPVTLTGTEANLGLGDMSLVFLGGDLNQYGTYNFTGLTFDYTMTIDTVPTVGPPVGVGLVGGPAHYNIHGELVGNADVTKTFGNDGIGAGSVAPILRILNVTALDPDNTATPVVNGTFANNGVPARVTTLNTALPGVGDLLFKIRIDQSPAVYGGAITAIEGRVASPTVPEPGSLALLLGSGVAGSAFFMRRRR